METTTVEVLVKLLKAGSPQTGDAGIFWLLGALLCAAAAVVVLCVKKGNVKSTGRKTSLLVALIAAGLAVTMVLSNAAFAAPGGPLTVTDLVGYVDDDGNVTFTAGKILNKSDAAVTVNAVTVSRPAGIDDGNAVWKLNSNYVEFFNGITTEGGVTNAVGQAITIPAGGSAPLTAVCTGLKAAKAIALEGKSVIKLSFVLANAKNTDGPRAYLPKPEDLGKEEKNTSLPNPFYFYDKTADPNGNGVVDSPEEWEARRAELKDILKYYLYGSRLDPLKSDVTIISVKQNEQLTWCDGAQATTMGMFGPSVDAEGTKALHPEGAIKVTTTMFMGMFPMTSVDKDDTFVYNNEEDFVYSGALAGKKNWKKGDTWADHTDIVAVVKLPSYTFTVNIKDTNPANDGLRSELAATEGFTESFSITVPQKPVVDGVVRDEKASRYGAGYPIFSGASGVQATALQENGYAVLSAIGDALYEKMYPPVDPAVPFDNNQHNPWLLDSGSLMHTGFGVSRSLDAIEVYNALTLEQKTALGDICPMCDPYSCAITSCSQGAKRAMIAGIFDTGDNGDTRFDFICPSDPGGGGLTGFRYFTECQLFGYQPPYCPPMGGGGSPWHENPYGVNESTQRAIQNSDEGNWFGDRAQIFTVHPEYCDNTFFDLHELIAVFGTTKEERAFIVHTGEAQDAWLSSPASVLDMMGAKEVWEYIGLGDNIACVVRDAGHANQDRDMADDIAIMDHLFYGVDKIVRKQLKTLEKPGSLKHEAKDGNGTIMPTKTFPTIASMSRNPYFIPSNYLDWSRPTKHYLWTSQNSVTAGVPLTFTFHTDAAKVELLLTDGKTVKTADVKDGIAEISITADEAKAGQYTAYAKGSKDTKFIEIAGWSVNDALRHAISDNSALGHDVGSGICFTTQLQNYNSKTDPVKLSMVVLSYGEGNPTPFTIGEEIALPGDEYDYDNKVIVDGKVEPQHSILQPYGATICLYPGTHAQQLTYGDKIVYKMRNAKIEALQGYEIAINVGLEMYKPQGGFGGGGDHQRFKPVYNVSDNQQPSWKPENLQITPKSGLALDESVWPMMGNWATDYDDSGALKSPAEVRPAHNEPTHNFTGTITLVESGLDFAKFEFDQEFGVDFAVAANVSGLDFEMAADHKSVTVHFNKVGEGTNVKVFVFRAVDNAGNMIDGPMTYTFTASDDN